MEREIRKEYRYKGLGFPVIIRDAAMVKIRGRWVLDIGLNRLGDILFKMMSDKPVRLSGDEIRFIRHHARMTLEKFAERFGVRHTAVMKWEKSGPDSTNMNWATEKDIRLFVLSEAGVPSKEFKQTYAGLRDTPTSQKRLHRLNFKELASR